MNLLLQKTLTRQVYVCFLPLSRTGNSILQVGPIKLKKKIIYVYLLSFYELSNVCVKVGRTEHW